MNSWHARAKRNRTTDERSDSIHGQCLPFVFDTRLTVRQAYEAAHDQNKANLFSLAKLNKLPQSNNLMNRNCTFGFEAVPML